MNSPEAKSELAPGRRRYQRAPRVKTCPVIIGAIALVVLLLGALMVARAASAGQSGCPVESAQGGHGRHRQGWALSPGPQVCRHAGTMG